MQHKTFARSKHNGVHYTSMMPGLLIIANAVIFVGTI